MRKEDYIRNKQTKIILFLILWPSSFSLSLYSQENTPQELKLERSVQRSSFKLALDEYRLFGKLYMSLAKTPKDIFSSYLKTPSAKLWQELVRTSQLKTLPQIIVHETESVIITDRYRISFTPLSLYNNSIKLNNKSYIIYPKRSLTFNLKKIKSELEKFSTETTTLYDVLSNFFGIQKVWAGECIENCLDKKSLTTIIAVIMTKGHVTQGLSLQKVRSLTHLNKIIKDSKDQCITNPNTYNFSESQTPLTLNIMSLMSPEVKASHYASSVSCEEMIKDLYHLDQTLKDNYQSKTSSLLKSALKDAIIIGQRRQNRKIQAEIKERIGKEEWSKLSVKEKRNLGDRRGALGNMTRSYQTVVNGEVSNKSGCSAFAFELEEVIKERAADPNDPLFGAKTSAVYRNRVFWADQHFALEVTMPDGKSFVVDSWATDGEITEGDTVPNSALKKWGSSYVVSFRLSTRSESDIESLFAQIGAAQTTFVKGFVTDEKYTGAKVKEISFTNNVTKSVLSICRDYQELQRCMNKTTRNEMSRNSPVKDFRPVLKVNDLGEVLTR